MNLKVKSTDSSNVYDTGKRRLNYLANLIANNQTAKYFFLSSLQELQRRESVSGMREAINIILARHLKEATKIPPISNDIFAKLSGIINKRKAVSASYGDFAIIEPFSAKTIIGSNIKPSIQHIYGSYYTNIVETLGNIQECLDKQISINELFELLSTLPSTICKTKERYTICPTCNKISSTKIMCKHKLIKLRLLRLEDIVLEALKKSIMLSAYVAKTFRNKNWNVIVEKQVQGTKDLYHQIDVLCRKKNCIMLVECKNWSTKIQLGPNDIFPILGKLHDVELAIKNIQRYKAFKVLKVFITTTKYHKRVQKLSSRKDLILIDNSEILETGDKWREKIESKIES